MMASRLSKTLFYSKMISGGNPLKFMPFLGIMESTIILQSFSREYADVLSIAINRDYFEARIVESMADHEIAYRNHKAAFMNQIWPEFLQVHSRFWEPNTWQPEDMELDCIPTAMFIFDSDVSSSDNEDELTQVLIEYECSYGSDELTQL